MKQLIRIIYLLFMPSAILYLYKSIGCFYQSTSEVCDMICFIGWKEGLLLCGIFNIYNLAEIIYKLSNNIYRRWIWIIIWYIIIFGVMAFPYMVISLINIKFSGFLHLLPVLFTIDYLFDFYSKKNGL